MKYTREEFIALMAKMKDKYRSAERTADSFNEVFGCGVGYDFLETSGFNWYMDYLIETLEKMFAENISNSNDADVISWYVYENDFGYGDGRYNKDVVIRTSGDLYDYMMREK